MMEEGLAQTESEDSPLHGFRGDRESSFPAAIPLAPSVAVSREVGARGGEIARRLSAKIGWPVYDREMLDYASQDPVALADLAAELSPAAAAWVEGRLRFLSQHNLLSTEGSFERFARVILMLAAKGEAIFVGRGAGFMLPRESTLHVRVTAPLADRVAYFSQWLRLTREEAAEQVRLRTQNRDAFQEACFRLPTDGILYDLMLNSSALGEELCADLIVLALRSKRAAMPETTDAD
jgi:hypothetical protein